MSDIEFDSEINGGQPIPISPTNVTYPEIESAYKLINDRLFGGELPFVLITLQRKEKRVAGYFSPRRFVSPIGQLTDELALNPAHLGHHNTLFGLQTIGHEMCHIWQFHFGNAPRKGYHNKEFAAKMESIGLMPSDTGKPGGNKVGQKMDDYVIEGGPFEQLANDLIGSGFKFPWSERDHDEISMDLDRLYLQKNAGAASEQATPHALPPGAERAEQGRPERPAARARKPQEAFDDDEPFPGSRTVGGLTLIDAAQMESAGLDPSDFIHDDFSIDGRLNARAQEQLRNERANSGGASGQDSQQGSEQAVEAAGSGHEFGNSQLSVGTFSGDTVDFNGRDFSAPTTDDSDDFAAFPQSNAPNDSGEFPGDAGQFPAETKPEPKQKSPGRIAFICPCKHRIWGKPSIYAFCGHCKNQYLPSTEE